MATPQTSIGVSGFLQVGASHSESLKLGAAQVDLVREFVDAIASGKPLVKQMLMGGGKTTVVLEGTRLLIE